MLSSSNVLHSSSLLMVSIIWFLNPHMVPLYGFSIIIWFPLYGFSIIIWFHYMVSQSSYGFHYMVSQSSYGSIIWFLNHHMVSIIWFLNHHMVPLNGFSIIIWYPKIWFLNHHMVPLYGFSIKKWFPLYGFSIIVWFHYMVSQSSYGSSVWFKLIVYKVKYSICCFKTLRYLLLTIFVCLTIYLFFFSIFLMVFSNGILSTNKYWYFFMLLMASLIIWFTSRKLSLSSFSTSLFFLATTLTKCELNLFEHNLITSLKLSSKSLSSEFDDIL